MLIYPIIIYFCSNPQLANPYSEMEGKGEKGSGKGPVQTRPVINKIRITLTGRDHHALERRL